VAIRESVITPLPLGASRTVNFNYPPSQIIVSGTVGQQQNLVNRQGTSWQNLFSVATGGGGGTNDGFTHYRGRPCYRYGDTGAGQATWAFTTAGLTIAFPQTKPVSLFADDFSCWSFTLLAAFTSGGNDAAFAVGPNAQVNLVIAANPGIGLAMRAANSMSVIACQGGGLTVDQQIANTTLNGASFDVADWHVYKLVIVGATNTTEAVLKAYSDGIQRASFSWGAGTLLPGQASGVNLGWNISVGSRAADWYLAVGGLSVAAAATEAGLV
jgi:hypothetical protein